MFDKKIDVDRHVESCLKKINSERERNLRSFAFAKLYFNIGECELARRYVSSYLSIKPSSAEAHQLLGKILEKLGRRDAALEEYRISLDLDPKQTGLVIKVCELLAQDDVLLEPNKARYWCEQAQMIDPQNEAVFNLKERLIANESNSPDNLRKLFLSELERRPTDVALRVRLLTHLLQNNQITEAYQHVAEIEQKNLSIFSHHFSWYETLTKVLVRYKNENVNSNNLEWDFWVLIISVLEKLATLSMDENNSVIKPLSDCISNVFNLDQMLLMTYQNISENSSDKQFIQEFFIHYKAQLCFLICTLVFKQAKKDQITYKEAINLALPLLLISYHSQPADLESVWLQHSSEKIKNQVNRWHKEASFRCSQAGHMLLSLIKGKITSFVDRVQQLCAGSWREKTFKNIFITRDQQLKIKTSYFVNIFSQEVIFKMPDASDLYRYDETAQLMYPDSLHHIIWIGLNNQPAKFHSNVFNGLQYSVKSLNNCAAETLNVLDIEAFIYCSVFCAQSQIEDSKHFIYYNQDKPSMLPASITEPLGTMNQAKWFTSVYRMYKNESGADVSDLRVTLIKGIEIVRCIGSHGLDVKLLVLLAKTFAQKAKNLNSQSEIEQVEIRAELYWKAALPLLEKLRCNQVITYPVKKWFEYRGKEITPTEITINIEEGKLFSAVQLMKKKSHEKALQMLENLKNPYASFYQAQIYKTLADEQMGHNKENLTSEMRSQHIILLSRARDCLYLTLDRLREPGVDRKHPLNNQLGTETEKIERLLSRIDPDICGNRNDCDGMSDENVSSVGSVGEHQNMSSAYIAHHSFINGNLTPRNDNLSVPYFNLDTTLNHSRRVEARPSPERLDAQLRQMVANKDAAVAHILEQNKIMVDSHRSLVDELRSFKDAVTTLTSSVDELRGIKKSVDELKVAVDDLQNLKEAVEQVYEIKKDLAELKKDTLKLKSNTINDEDLYALEDEYGVDYNLGANASGFNSAAFYSNFPQRLQGANTLAYGAPGLYGMYPMYPYGGLGLGQPGTLPFPEGPIADLRMGSIAQGLSHTGIAQTTLAQTGLPNIFQNKFDSNIPTPFTTNVPARSVTTQPVIQTYTVPSQIVSTTITNVTPISAPGSVSSTVTSNLPVNVVITASDPLPTTSTTQPVLSVTIPPQHLRGNQQNKKQPHNYQIQLPVTTQPSFSAVTASITSAPMPVSTQNLLSNIAPPVFSSLTVQSPVHQIAKFGLQDKSNQKLDESHGSHKSRNDSNISDSSAIEEHDPCPDFKPIIPLPDEVHVTTGEENEAVLFCERAKLYRYVEKEWKERGTGNIKLLYNVETGKVRVLMRRDQVHKICANHCISPEMILTPMPNADRAYIWAANDYSEENMILEKFCVRFKTAEIAIKFYESFENAKKLVKDLDKSQREKRAVEKPLISSTSNVTPAKLEPVKSTASLGGFVFTSTPTFKPKTDIPKEVEKTPVSTAKPSPFASFTFEPKLTDTPKMSDFKPVQKTETLKDTSTPKTVGTVVNLSVTNESEDFVPTAEFKPVIPLPDLVEVKTGEENSEVLYEVRAKLLRFDSEWKERGVGMMKILKDKTTIRLVMRREQIHKVCCNHQLLKSMVFTNMPSNNKVLNWCAQDYAENVLKTEMFAIRFKTTEICDEFLNKIHEAQAMLDSSNYVIADLTAKSLKSVEWDDKISKDIWECTACYVSNETKNDKCSTCGTEKDINVQSPQKFKPAASPQAHAWGDKFKQKLGTWECKNCYVHNDGKKNYCEACDSPKNDTLPLKDGSVDQNVSGDQFSFGVASSSSNVSSSFSFSQTATKSNWDNTLFKPNTDVWSCNGCYVSNDNAITQCVSCGSNKDGSVPKSGFAFGTGGLSSSATATTFSFGTKPVTTTTTTTGWGDKFKPKEGSWDCKACYVNNTGDNITCVSCNTPKEGVKTDTKPSTTYSFGTPSTTTSSWGDKFKPKEGSWSCEGCYVTNKAEDLYCVACNSPKDSTVPKKPQGIDLSTESKFIFGTSSTSEPLFGAKTTSTVGFSFGLPQTKPQTTGFTFGIPKDLVPEKTEQPPLDLASKTTFSFTMTKATETPEPKKEEFVFGSPNKYSFEFKPRSPRKTSCGEGGDSDGNVSEDDGEHIYFKPVIPLPDKVEVKTGEEDEQILYCHRAKLFRFTNSEWKERGIGDIKILKHSITGKLRVLMRREQVLKICLNHYLTSDIDYKAKDDRTWLFSAADYSEGEISCQQFCIRFKNGEIAKQFIDAVDNARSSTTTKSTSESKEESDDDVIFVNEIKVTPEEEKKALSLMLPKNFYAYLQKPPCKGCIGCNPDDYVFPKLKTINNKTKSTDKKETTTTFSFGTPTTPVIQKAFNPFGVTISAATTPTTKPQVTFSFTTPVNSESTSKSPLAPAKLTSPTTGSIFSMPKDNTQTRNIFSGSPSGNIFGGTPKTEENLFRTNIFSNTLSTENKGATTTTTSTFSQNPTSFSFTKTESGTPKSTGTIFGTNTFGTEQNVFSGTLFGQKDDKSKDKPLIFGSSGQTYGSVAQTTSTLTFGATALTTSTPSFGSLANTTTSLTFGSVAQTTTAPAFGSLVQTTTTSTFGSLIKTTTAPAFGSIAQTTTAPTFGSIAQTTTAPSFGSIAQTTTAPTFGSVVPTTTVPIFGSIAQITTSPTFGSIVQTTTTSTFGSVAQTTTSSTFGSLVQTTTSGPMFGLLSQTQSTNTAGPLLKCDSSLSFAALASEAPTFVTKDESKPFTFEGTGTLVFGSKKPVATTEANDSEVKEDDDNQNETNDDNYDPHYEPIVPLPEAIVVKTGEEEEEVLFIERAKLYRFCNESGNGEWKERGVGQIKVLHHPLNATYRFLMRREQVHKLVLNQLITSDLDLQPLQSSDRAWLWGGYNYTDDGGSLEKLAVRFKNPEIAQQFYNAVQSAISKVQLNQSKGEEEGDEQDDDEANEEEYGSDDSDETKSTMFSKRCTLCMQEGKEWVTLGMGVLKIYYDSDLYGSRIVMYDDHEEQLSNTIIAINTTMKVEGTCCIWRAMEWSLDPAVPRVLKAMFSSTAAAQEMYYNFEESLHYAQQCEIVDTLPDENF